jgi:uncharacterized protein (TIGR04255 family)
MTETTTDLSDTDVPLGGLPSADRTLLPAGPLEVAIIKVRFTSGTTDIPVDVATRVRDVLGHAANIEYTTIQPATQGTMQINFGGEGPSWSGGQTQGWQIASADGRRSVTLMPGSLIMQTTDYERWSLSMKAPLTAVLNEIAQDVGPTLVQRIGLRYVDRFQDNQCKTIGDWRGKIDDTLLGPILNSVFGAKVGAAQQHVEVALDSKHGAVLRHGPAPDLSTKSINYLLDLDVFNHAAEPFMPKDVIYTAERLNRTALSLFQACVSTDYLESLQRKGTAL